MMTCNLLNISLILIKRRHF